MDRLGLDIETEAPNANKSTAVNAKEARRKSIERCIQSLEHATYCTDKTCSLQACIKMKKVVSHAKGCKRKNTQGCPICKQLIALCCYHAKSCSKQQCMVPYCQHIKHRLQQQQLQQKLHQRNILRRRIAAMNMQNKPPMVQQQQQPTIPPNVQSSTMHPNRPQPNRTPPIQMPPQQKPINQMPTSQGTPPPNVTAKPPPLPIVAQQVTDMPNSIRPNINMGNMNMMNPNQQQPQSQQPRFMMPNYSNNNMQTNNIAMNQNMNIPNNQNQNMMGYDINNSMMNKPIIQNNMNNNVMMQTQNPGMMNQSNIQQIIMNRNT